MTLSLRQRLQSDQVAIGLNARHSRTAEIGAILGDCGYHWFFVDQEHNPVPFGIAYEMCLGAIRAGVTPFARARTNSPEAIGSQMTNGVMGVFVPHVDTAEQAARAALAARYPPDGILSVPGAVPQFGYKRVPLPEATARFNAEVLGVAMIESAEAVGNVEAIAATAGIDALFIGASDLTFDMGIPSEYGHERTAEAVARVCAAAQANAIHAGMGGVKEDADWARYIKLGIRLVLTENDLSLLITRATERAAFFDGLATG